jgi:hypothetical protein
MRGIAIGKRSTRRCGLSSPEWPTVSSRRTGRLIQAVLVVSLHTACAGPTTAPPGAPQTDLKWPPALRVARERDVVALALHAGDDRADPSPGVEAAAQGHEGRWERLGHPYACEPEGGGEQATAALEIVGTHGLAILALSGSGSPTAPTLRQRDGRAISAWPRYSIK